MWFGVIILIELGEVGGKYLMETAAARNEGLAVYSVYIFVTLAENSIFHLQMVKDTHRVYGLILQTKSKAQGLSGGQDDK